MNTRPPITDSEREAYEAYQATMWSHNLMMHNYVLAKVSHHLAREELRKDMQKVIDKQIERKEE